MPYALSIGVDLVAFWGLTPHDLFLIAEGYNIASKRQIENENTIAYIQGLYIAEAIMSTVGNQLSDKHSRKFEYPDKPFDFNLDGNKEEREKERQLELFKARLNAQMSNFNLSKEKG